MSLNANNSKNTSGGTKAEALEPGTYPARVVSVVDLGLQAQRPYQGQEKAPAYEILVTYELLDEYMKDDDGNDMEDKPRWFSENFPLHSLESERAKSTKRYNSLDPSGAAGGDWSRLLGVPCMLTLVNNSNAKTGRVYTNVAGVAAMRSKDADKAKDLVNPATVFDLDTPDMEAFNSLPKWVQKKIMEGLEYKGSKLDTLLGGKTAPVENDRQDDADEDEVPY